MTISIRTWTRVLPASIALAAAAAAAAPAAAQVTGLERIGRFDGGLGETAAEISAFDPVSRRLFVVNAVAATVDVVDLTDPAAPAAVTSIDVTGFGAVANSVDVANGLVAVAIQAEVKTDPGVVAFFDTAGAPLGSVPVGALPDMVTFAPGGVLLVVANEGEPADDYQTDPEGTVSIVDLTGGVGGAIVTHVRFDEFDQGGPRAGELPAEVRVFGPGASVAQDLEPEYVAVSPDGTTAWVTLQENNAIAAIDLVAGTVEAIFALGFKDHSTPGNALDPSNEDGGVQIANQPVWGMYLPDAIAADEIDGTVYLFTANEGDARDYDGFSEEERMGDLELDATAFPNAAFLQEDENLGRLNSTTALGDTDGDGDVDRLFAYGARSFTIWNGETGALVFDSGDQFEQTTAVEAPALFNSQGDAGGFDSRTDDKGPEPEAIAVAPIDGRVYAFVGLERIGGLFVYDVTDPAHPFFVLYEPSGPGDLAPEGLEFVPAASSPNGEPLVVVSNEVSGSVAIYEVQTGGGGGGSGEERCTESETALCLQDGRFRVEAAWRTGAGDAAPAGAVRQNDGSGYFWFFSEDNTEVTVKVLDACSPEFDRFWVFAAGMTNVDVRLLVTDTDAGVSKPYQNPLGTLFQPIADTDAFATCP